MQRTFVARIAFLGLAFLALTPLADAMCGYFRPVIRDIKSPPVLQPSQIAFITWDPAEQIETVTVQPRFEGSALDFGMVIPTPTQPKLHEMPRDFFKALGVATQPKRRAFPESKLMPQCSGGFGAARRRPRARAAAAGSAVEDQDDRFRRRSRSGRQSRLQDHYRRTRR